MSNLTQPHDLAAEEAVLGAVLLSNVALPRLIVDVGLTAGDFHHTTHAAIWEEMVNLAIRGDTVDEVTLRGSLQSRGMPDSGLAKIDILAGSVPNAAAVVEYANRVIELAQWRQVAAAAMGLSEAVNAQDKALRHEAETKLMGVRRSKGDTRTPEGLRDDIMRHLEGESAPAWPTPWPSLNEALGRGLRAGEVTLLGGWTSHGKALCVETPILTPDGWSTMLDLKAGDHVFDENGRPVRVLAATEVQLGRPCMEVELTGGARIVADEEHEWFTWTAAAHRSDAAARRRVGVSSSWDQQHQRVLPAVRSTREIASTLRLKSRDGRFNHSIPVCRPLEFPKRSLPVDPYVLGAWLGDGDTRHAAITTPDAEVLQQLAEAGHEIRPHKNPIHFGIGGLTQHLRSLGVLGNKHIPASYLCAAVDQRVALLQGLMDSDGHVTVAGQCEFSTTSHALAAGAHELLAGLGVCVGHTVGRAMLRGKDCGEHHRLMFATTLPVFRLARKLERVPQHVRREGFRSVRAVRHVGSRPVKCIQVDSSTGLYLAGRDCIVTHNSVVTDQILRWCADRGAKVHLYANEMSSTTRALRVVSAITSVPLGRLSRPPLRDQQEAERVVRALNDGLPFGITQVSDWSADDIARDIRFRGWDVCALDLVHRLPFREERDLAQISTTLNTAAQTSGAHLIAVVHLNEGRAQNATLPQPVLRDIRGSGMLKNDADNVLFIHRNEEEADSGVSIRRNGATLSLAKCRNGRLEDLPLLFDPPRSRFLEPAGAL